MLATVVHSGGVFHESFWREKNILTAGLIGIWFGLVVFWGVRFFFFFRGKLSYKSNFLCFLSCRCLGVALAGLRQLGAVGLSASPFWNWFGETKQNKTKKSMHRFDWRTRRLGWRSHVCLRAGHCWVPAASSGVRDERTIMSVDSRALCESRRQRLESLGESCCLSIRCKILFLSLSPAFPLLSSLRWPIELHTPRASV